MKIAVCDDDQRITKETAALLQQWAEKNSLSLTIQSYTNGDDLINGQKAEWSDLIFLDVIMPLFNGIDTARELRNQNLCVPIIFLTSSKEFAVDSYEVKALNYLIKPVAKEKLFSVLDEFVNTATVDQETFTAHTSVGFCKIAINKVDYLEAQNKQVVVYLSNGTTIEIKELFSKCEEIFSLEKGFFRCHRSYIIRLNRIEQFTKTSITTANGTSLPISRNNYSAFKEAYFSYMFQ